MTPRAGAAGGIRRLPRAARAIAALVVLGVGGAAADASPAVAVAASVKFAFDEIVGDFSRQTDKRVRVTYGSSGNFRRQIERGAPFELFLSADEDYALALHRQGLTVDSGEVYAVGRLVLFAPRGSPVSTRTGLDGLRRALEAGRVGRFAIANPEHAPYGRAAREVLENARLWTAIVSHLVVGENAAQAAQFVVSGAAQGGLLPYSLALQPKLATRGDHALLPESHHTPLRQRMVLMRDAGATARALYRYLRSARAGEILRRHGFAVPDE